MVTGWGLKAGRLVCAVKARKRAEQLPKFIPLDLCRFGGQPCGSQRLREHRTNRAELSPSSKDSARKDDWQSSVQ